MSTEDKVVVRRRWNGNDTAEVDADSLWDLHVRNEPGGVCGPFPRAFLFARVWCDKMASGALGHVCRDGEAPHEMLVCILPTDNSAPMYERLRGKARG